MPLYFNMYNNEQGYVTDLPELIQPFYLDEERDGVNYTMVKPRVDLKSWDFVAQVINYTFKTYCIEKACEAEEWVWHDSYIEWLESKPLPDAGHESYTEVYNEWLALEPINSSTQYIDALKEYHLEDAVVTRVSGIYADIYHNGQMYQTGKGKDGDKGIDNFNEAVQGVQLTGDATATVNWITTDNTLVTLSYSDIKSIVRKFNTRKQAIFDAYGLWRADNTAVRFRI